MTTTPTTDPQQESLTTIAARLLGSIKSEAKTKVARENGRKGGRPPGIPQSPEARRKISEGNRRARQRPKE